MGKAQIAGSVVAGFPSPAEQYLEPLGSRFARRVRFPTGREPPQGAVTLDLNELLVKRPAATYFVRVQGDSMIGSKDDKAVDALNRHYGRGKVFSAAEGMKREWKMKRSLLSKRATTCWDDLMVVK